MWAKKSIKNYRKRNKKNTYAALYVRVWNFACKVFPWLKLNPVLTKSAKGPGKSPADKGTDTPLTLMEEYKAWLFIQRIGNGAGQEMKGL